MAVSRRLQPLRRFPALLADNGSLVVLLVAANGSLGGQLLDATRFTRPTAGIYSRYLQPALACRAAVGRTPRATCRAAAGCSQRVTCRAAASCSQSATWQAALVAATGSLVGAAACRQRVTCRSEERGHRSSQRQ